MPAGTWRSWSFGLKIKEQAAPKLLNDEMLLSAFYFFYAWNEAQALATVWHLGE
jgi:hypothetical protein